MTVLRYKIASWLLDTFYAGGDMWQTHPKTVALANWICPGGIPESW